jgi:hypothetical protein
MFTMDRHVSRHFAGADAKHQLLLLILLLASIYSVIALVKYVRNADERKFWNSHPWAGLGKLFFPRTLAGLEAIRHTRDIVERGFKEVC